MKYNLNNPLLTVIIPIYNQEELIIRALDSIPSRDDIEIICVDDGSQDKSWDVMVDYANSSDKNIILLYNDDNQGVAYSVNRGLDNATGEYIVLLGSDDYFINLDKALKELEGDLVYFDLEINDGTIWHLNHQTKDGLCGSVKFMKRTFVGDSRNPLIKWAEDYYFYEQLKAKNPTEKFLGYVVKHYNYPRTGSLTWQSRM